MSYETNPILIRLKNNKGWKNSAFPNKNLNYSYEILVWFKIYLLLKAYLSLHRIKLLTCEIRISENRTHILYLSVTKQFDKKIFSRSKWKTKSFLQKLQSPLTNLQNNKARFSLYLDFKTLQKQSFLTFNNWQKKILSKAWISKPRLSSWINFATYIHRSRLHAKINQQFLRKFKKTFFITCNNNFSKDLNFEQHINYNFQKKLKVILTRIKREIWFIKKCLNTLAQSKKTSTSLKHLFYNLTSRYKYKKRFIQKLQFLYQTSISVARSRTIIRAQNQKNTSEIFSHKFKQKKNQILFKKYWFAFKKQIGLLQKQAMFFRHQPQYLRLCRNRLFKKSNKYLFFFNQNRNLSNSFIKFQRLYAPLRQKRLSLPKLFIKKNKIFVRPQKYRIKRTKSLITFDTRILTPIIIKKAWNKNPQFLTKTRILKKSRTIFEFNLPKFIRFRQKYKRILRLNQLRRKQMVLQKNKKKRIQKNKRIINKYRLPYRYNYKTHVSFLTNLKLKYLIQDFIQQYFAIHVYIKIVWPLTQIKNLKFYRLVFFKHKGGFNSSQNNPEQKIFKTYCFSKKIPLEKQYVFGGNTTKHLKLRSTMLNLRQKQKMQKMFFRKLKQKQTKKKSSITVNFLKPISKSSGVFNNKKKQKSKNQISNVIARTRTIFFSAWKKKLKKNKYLLFKNKVIQEQAQKRLNWLGKTTYVANLLSTLTIFAKYLDPQPLAENLAQILGQTKKHSFTLKLVNNILSTMKLKRGVGYRIALIGRANGASKTRTIYLRKLNRNRSRQTFSKNINFGSAQARATIGAFGVKIWVFF